MLNPEFHEQFRVVEAVAAAGIDRPLSAFNKAMELVSAGRAHSAILLTQYFVPPSDQPDRISSPFFENGEKFKGDTDTACKLIAAANVLGKQKGGFREYKQLRYRAWRPLDPDFAGENEYYLHTRAWVMQTIHPKVFFGIQSVTNPAGEILRRTYLMRKPFDLKEFLSRWNPFIPPPETPGTRS